MFTVASVLGGAGSAFLLASHPERQSDGLSGDMALDAARLGKRQNVKIGFGDPATIARVVGLEAPGGRTGSSWPRRPTSHLKGAH